MRRLSLSIPLLAMAFAACGSPATPPPTAAPPAALAFGQTHTWPGGDTVTVSAPRRMSEEPSSTDGHAGQFLVVDVTVRNGGTGVRSAQQYLTLATINDRSVDYAVMRGHADLVRSSASIPPGGSLTWSEAYPVAGAAPVKFQVQAMGAAFDSQRPVVFYEGTV